MHVRIAKEIEWLVINQKTISNLSLHQQYKERLKARGLVSYDGGLFRARKISQKFVDYYGNDFLEKLNSKIKIEDSRNWISTLINKKRYILFDIYYLLCF